MKMRLETSWLAPPLLAAAETRRRRRGDGLIMMKMKKESRARVRVANRERGECDVFKEEKGEGRVWFSEIRGFSDDL